VVVAPLAVGERLGAREAMFAEKEEEVELARAASARDGGGE